MIRNDERMNKKKRLLIELLLEQNGPITAGSIATSLGVSVRTVKSYIQDINLFHEKCIQSNHTGYIINKALGAHILRDNEDHIPQSSEERIVYILRKMFYSSDEIDIFDLSDELYISVSTLKNELAKLKKRLSRFDLQLISRNNQIQVEGLERNKRKLLSSILYDESNVNFLNMKAIQESFTNIDIVFIRTTVLETFDQYHYFVNDYSLINLVLHIAIAIDRIQKHNINEEEAESLTNIRLHEYELAHAVVHKLEEHFKLEFTQAEIYELTLLLISRATTIDYKSINKENIEDFIGKPCLDLVNELILDVSSHYYIDLSEKEFFIQFALHIKNLLVRAKNDYFSKNPLTEGIKTSCPLIYDVAVNLAGLIKQRTNITINDDEIAYIAFHLGSTIEAQKRLNFKVNTILYCPNYYNLNSKLVGLLNDYFSNDILISNVLTEERDFEKAKKANLIISTVPFNNYLAPVQVINPILTDADISAIRKRIQQIQADKRRETFQNYLTQLITPALFEKKQNLQTKEKAIHYMVKKLHQLDYVNESFENEILDREKLSPTAFNSFAIPHAMRLDAKKTGIYVISSVTPIQWDEKQIHLVLMLCFNKNERYIFNEIFDPLAMILSNPENVESLINEQDYSSFIEKLCSFME